MKKDIAIIIGIVIFAAFMYGLTLRGAPGNPEAASVRGNLDQATKALELSPERGRYVHVANMAEHGVYNLSASWSDIASPDVGISPDGKISSFFAPGVAYMTLPFYLVGEKYNLAQVATFAAESVITIITLIFIYLIGRRIFNLPVRAAIFSVLVFAFASTSWSYAITLYQNAFTTCFIVTAFYAVWRFKQQDTPYSWLYAAYVWLAYGLAISVDYPNALIMLPIMLYLAYSTFAVIWVEEGITISVRWSAIFTVIFFMFITGLQFWHNATYYGGWSHTAGGLKNYIHAPTAPATTTPALASAATTSSSKQLDLDEDKDVVEFFHEFKMFAGVDILLVSSERGIFFFSPIFILALFGIVYLGRQKEDAAVYVVPLALIAVNLLLYTSWGDPWGGWAFGPRYLIPSMPWLALFVGIFLASIKGYWTGLFSRIVVFMLFMLSSAVALLGALTTNAIPPKVEAIALPVKEYTYLRDLPFLRDGASGSFVYNTYFANSITLVGYYILLYSLLLIVAGCLLMFSLSKRHD